MEPKLEKVEDSEPIFHQEKLQELNQKIDEDIQLLSQELLQYHQIRRYVEVYREKNQSYYVIAKELEEKVKEKLTTLDPKQDDQYGTFLRYHSLAQTMTAKVNRFATTSHVMQQELFKVNQAISNHFITMEALQMAKDGLLPIIVFELALGKGQDTEKNALNLSHHVIDLLQSLLTRNVSDAKHHMELLKSSNLPKELFDSLNDGVRAYLDDIHQLPLFGTKNGEENPEGISLSLFPKIEKEEVPLDGDPSPIQKSIKKS